MSAINILAGDVYAENITATGNVEAENITATGDFSAINILAGYVHAENITATGNVEAINITATGDVTADTIVATGDVTADSIVAFGDVAAINITATGDVTADSIIANGDVTAVNITATGNVEAENITATGDVTADSIIANGDVTAVNITATGNVEAENITATGDVTAENISATGDVYAKNITATYVLTAEGSITATGDVNAFFILATGDVTATNITSTGVVEAENISATGDVEAGAITANTLTATNQTLTLTETGSQIGTTNLGEGTLIVNSNAGGDVGNLTAKTVNINGDVSATKIDNLNTLSVSKGKLTLGQSSDLSGAAVTLADDGVVETSAGTLTVGDVSGKGTISGKDGVILYSSIDNSNLTIVAETGDITTTNNINAKSLTATNGNIDATDKNITAEKVIAKNSLTAEKLILKGSGSKIGTANINNITLDTVEWSNTIPVLAADSFKYNDSTELGGNVTLDISNLTISGENPTGSMTLLQSDTANNFSGLKLKFSDSEAAVIPATGNVVKTTATNQTKETKGISFTYDRNQSVFLADSNKKVNYVFADTYKNAELGSMKWSDGGYSFSSNEAIDSSGLTVSLADGFKVEGAEDKKEGDSLDLLDLSNVAGGGKIKNSVDTTKTLTLDDENPTSDMIFSLNRTDSIKSNSDKTKITYTIGGKIVTNATINGSIEWNETSAYYENTNYSFNNDSTINISGVTFTSDSNPLNNSMTLISNAKGSVTGTPDFEVSLNNTMLYATTAGESMISGGNLEFKVTGMTLNQVTVNGVGDDTIPEDWATNAIGIEVDTGSTVLDYAEGASILTSNISGLFKEENFTGINSYNDKTNNKHAFKADKDKGVTLNGYQIKGVKASDDGSDLIYAVDSTKNVTKITLDNITANDSRDMSETSYNFSNLASIDASKLEFTFTNDQVAALSNTSSLSLVKNTSDLPANIDITYKNDIAEHTQAIDYSLGNGTALLGTLSGTLSASGNTVNYSVNGIRLDEINLANWDNTKEASTVSDGWTANEKGVSISGVFADPGLSTGETKSILSASSAIFKDENIDEAIRYADGSFNNALENGIYHSGVQTGGVKASDDGKELIYYSLDKSVNKFDLATWDGEKSVNIPFNWELIDGISVETDNMSHLPESDIEKEVFILKSDNEGFFSDVAINGENIYGKKQNKFTESDKDESVIIAGTQDKGVTLDDSKTNLVYKFGKRDVSSLKVNTIRWEDGVELLNRDKYNYSKLTSIDTKDFNISYEKPETVAVNHSMTLLTANETFKDMAPNEKSLPYQYEPVSGVTMDAIIRSSLEARNGKVTLTTLSNNAGKLTFGHVDWLDKGALIDHKTLLNNVSFDGASVDTTKIAFINKEKLDADMQMTLVSDFDGIPGTITGSKYKVGTAYEGEGSAYMDGNDLVFKTKTGAGLSDETHTTVMAMEGGVAMLAAGNEHVGNAIEGLSLAANAGSDGVSTYASMGGSSSRYETGSHVDSNSWNCTLAVGKNLEKRDGTYEYGLFAEYGRGNYTLHMDDVADAGSGNTHYTGGGLLLKFTNRHDVYTEASFRMGNMKDKASSLLHDGAGNAYGYDISAKYRGGHIGFGKICREESGNKLELFGKYFYNQREGINFVAGADQYAIDDVRSRILRAGFRLSSTDKKWNRYGGIAYDYEFGGKSEGTVNGNAVRAASIKGGTLRGEFGYCREATKTNPWKTDISLYGFTGQRRGFGGSVAFEYHF